MKETERKVLTRKDVEKLFIHHVVIPEGYTEISGFVFCEDFHISFKIPSSINNIDKWVLNECNIVEIAVDEENKHYSSREGVLFNKYGSELIKFPRKREQETYIVPAGVMKIGEQAFYCCEILKHIVLPEGLLKIESGAFISCINLSKIEIPYTVEYIEDSAFLGCTGLMEIVIPSSVKEIGPFAFGCGVDGIIKCFEGSVAHKYAFENDMKFELK